MMTKHVMLHPRADVCRLYLPRAEDGRGLISVADTVNIERRSLQRHASIMTTGERLLATGVRVL